MRYALNVLFLLVSVSTAFAQGNGNGGNQSGGSGGTGQEDNNGNAGNTGSQNGNGNGNARGNAGGNDNGNAGSNGNGNTGGNSDAPQGNGNGNGNGQNNSNANGQEQSTGDKIVDPPSGTARPPSIDADGTVHYTPDDARDAVVAGRAVSLNSLLPDLQSRTAGDVIDAELLNVRGFLVYAVKVLRPTGHVTTEFYYAQSGNFIGSEP